MEHRRPGGRFQSRVQQHRRHRAGAMAHASLPHSSRPVALIEPCVEIRRMVIYIALVRPNEWCSITDAERGGIMRISKIVVAAAGAFICVSIGAQTASEIVRPPAIIPLASEPAPRLHVYSPLAEPLARGVVIVQYRTENVRIIPVFGTGALEVSPRVGHLHVTVDDRPGTWAHTSEDPIIVMGLKAGEHKILLEVADPTHKILTSETVLVTVPEQKASNPQKH
jgi:hypothetical protein